MKGKDDFTRFIGINVGNCNWKQFGSTYDVETEIKLESMLIEGPMWLLIWQLLLNKRTKGSSWKTSLRRRNSEREWKEVEELTWIYILNRKWWGYKKQAMQVHFQWASIIWVLLGRKKKTRWKEIWIHKDQIKWPSDAA